LGVCIQEGCGCEVVWTVLTLPFDLNYFSVLFDCFNEVLLYDFFCACMKFIVSMKVSLGSMLLLSFRIAREHFSYLLI